MQHPALAVVICSLIALELIHLRWIWWTQWQCKRCGVPNKDCACGHRKWMMYL